MDATNCIDITDLTTAELDALLGMDDDTSDDEPSLDWTDEQVERFKDRFDADVDGALAVLAETCPAYSLSKIWDLPSHAKLAHKWMHDSRKDERVQKYTRAGYCLEVARARAESSKVSRAKVRAALVIIDAAVAAGVR